MHGGKLVEQVRLKELHTRFKKLNPYQQRQGAAFQQGNKREDQVHQPDIFMVGGKKPSSPTLGFGIVIIVNVILGVTDCDASHVLSSLPA